MFNKIKLYNPFFNSKNYWTSFLLVLLSSPFVFSQITTQVDTTTIKIGEEIIYTIQVQADSTATVLFPEGQTFKPLEVIESYKPDSTYSKDKIINLIKKYGLTQFDSGHYTIPSQRVVINNKPFDTDSVLVEVQDVLVDTTKQKMYDIKPFIKVQKPPFNFKKWLYILIPILVILGLILLYIFRKQKQKAKQKQQLPPYEEAITALQQLDNSTLKTENPKEYYSQLSEIVKRYLDREVDERALESTTNELIERLKLHKDAGDFNFNTTTIKKLEAVLKRADLVKFAKMQEDEGQAKTDRKTIEEVINETKEVIPEPTEEELLKNKEYAEQQRKRKKRKRLKIVAISAVLLIFLSLGTLLGIYGVSGVKDILSGTTTKAMLDKPWIKSEYGNPAIIVETPEVLVRKEVKKNTQTAKNAQVFQYGNILDKFWITVSTVSLPEGTEVELPKALEQGLKTLESYGAINVVVKQETFETEKGIKGLKGYGEFNIKNKSGKISKTPLKYETLFFKQNGGLQNILIVYKKDDADAARIKDRIINSVELEIKEPNAEKE